MTSLMTEPGLQIIWQIIPLTTCSTFVLKSDILDID